MAIVQTLAKAGTKVGICSRNAKTVQERAKGLDAVSAGAWGRRSDVRSEKGQEAFFAEAKKRFSKLDICVPNAGEATLGSIAQTSLED